MVEGRRMTAWKTVQRDLEYARADVVDEEVVVDDNLVTSRQPDDIPAFIERSLQHAAAGRGRARRRVSGAARYGRSRDSS